MSTLRGLAGAMSVAIGVMSGAALAQTPPPPRVFPNDAGVVFNFIKPDKTADFEMVMMKLKDALRKSKKPERRKQAATWKVFKSPDLANGNALYVFITDPPIKGADYQIVNLIKEAFPPAQAKELVDTYVSCYAQVMNIINLDLLPSSPSSLGP